MPMLISTGKCPSPAGRKTSALSLAPSRIGMSTSFSSFILYVGSDGLVCLRATCSCTIPPQQLLLFHDRPIAVGRLIGTDRLSDDASRGGNARLRASPYLVRGLDHQAELGDFPRDIHGVAADAAGETALRTQRELLQRRMLRRFVDPALELVLGFELAALGGDQAEDRDLALGEKAQRLEPAGARAVVFEKVAVDIDLVEDQFGDRLVAALRDPGAGEIAAAQMHADRHVLRTAFDRVVEKPRIGLRQCRRIFADIGDLPAQIRVAEIGKIDLVDLQVAATSGGE